MNLSEAQIQQLMTDGGSFTDEDGFTVEIEKEAPSDSPNKALLGLILEQSRQIAQLTSQMAVKATGTPAGAIPSPVPAPVQVPTAQHAFWDCQVTERDKDGRIARVQFRGK